MKKLLMRYLLGLFCLIGVVRVSVLAADNGLLYPPSPYVGLYDRYLGHWNGMLPGTNLTFSGIWTGRVDNCVAIVGDYSNGIPCGVWSEFDYSGAVRRRMSFLDDNRFSEIFFGPEGLREFMVTGCVNRVGGSLSFIMDSAQTIPGLSGRGPASKEDVLTTVYCLVSSTNVASECVLDVSPDTAMMKYRTVVVPGAVSSSMDHPCFGTLVCGKVSTCQQVSELDHWEMEWQASGGILAVTMPSPPAWERVNQWNLSSGNMRTALREPELPARFCRFSERVALHPLVSRSADGTGCRRDCHLTCTAFWNTAGGGCLSRMTVSGAIVARFESAGKLGTCDIAYQGGAYVFMHLQSYPSSTDGPRNGTCYRIPFSCSTFVNGSREGSQTLVSETVQDEDGEFQVVDRPRLVLSSRK